MLCVHIMVNVIYSKEKGGNGMSVSEKQLASAKKYHGKFDDIKLRVPKGKREEYKKLAQENGKSLNTLVIELLEDYKSRK